MLIFQRLNTRLGRLYQKAVRSFLKPIIVIGDSHVNVFNLITSQLRVFPKYFSVHMVSGATASGLQNPNSVTGSKEKFDDAVNSAVSSNSNVYIQLGEVDVGFIIWYRALKNVMSITESVDLTLKRYEDWLLTLQKSNLKISLISVPLPTLEKFGGSDSIANFRKEIQATKKERTELTFLFNQSIKEICEKLGYAYIDLDKVSTDVGGLVKNMLVSKIENDHHYALNEYSRLIFNQINFK